MTEAVSASGGPAADNELRAKLIKAARQALQDTNMVNHWTIVGESVAKALLPLVVAFGDARYREGRNDASAAIDIEAMRKPRGWREHVAMGAFLDSRAWLRFAARLARGEG